VLEFFASTYFALDEGEITLTEAIEKILSNKVVWREDLAEIAGLAEAVIKNIQNIESLGIKGALKLL